MTKRPYAFIIIFLLAGCRSGSILVEHNTLIQYDIDQCYLSLDGSKFGSFEETGKAFALVNHCEYLTTVTFNYVANMPTQIRSQIKQSNRFLITNQEKIPIIFNFDSGNITTRHADVGHGMIGGMLIKFDNSSGEVLLSGSVE